MCTVSKSSSPSSTRTVSHYANAVNDSGRPVSETMLLLKRGNPIRQLDQV
ncbi:hypothetical protein SPRG_12338 [Saprolegnia parasitica CBS 223.65]|uniref:Uncharacterized protein n=1 Tax=Saprolegnia parasitica (strain CBS 223.65) TaxID=695850 RepID=A0A067BU96_SAPPC|nr:hypothetical protein SPRG_12338 [Saprolegnia parasitica CBS 223.65]KDO21838.1 hypothetical protein SPRG_12338 [Saprolegnia parasitica CBS 223.65]|eukprot:XP_012207396.1 hypothetical protein SPRG_12338 [Saprolegnia parasitica CBS 223.65]